MTILKLIPFWIFILLFHLGGNIHYTFLPILGSRLTSTWITGIIIGSLSFTQLMLDIPAGILLDRFGYNKMLRIGTIIFILSCSILAFVPGLLGFILASISAAFGWLFIAPGVNAYILSSSPKEHTERFIVYRDTFSAIGIGLGSIAITYTVKLPPTLVGLISAIVMFAALFFIWISPKDKISVHQEIKIEHHHFYIRRNIFKKLFNSICKLNPASWMLLLQGICSSIFYSVVWFTVPFMVADPSKKIFGISLGIFDLAILLLGFLLGKVCQKIKEKTSIIIGLSLFSLAGLIIGRQTEWLFLLFAFLATTGDELSNIALWSWLSKLNKDHNTDGEVASVISFFCDLGWTIGPILGGILYSIFGGELAITFGAVPILITFLISVFLINKHNHTLKINYYSPNYPKRSRSKR